jgi:hypothetical protein
MPVAEIRAADDPSDRLGSLRLFLDVFKYRFMRGYVLTDSHPVFRQTQTSRNEFTSPDAYLGISGVMGKPDILISQYAADYHR